MYELYAPSDLSNAELHELMQVLVTLSDGDYIEMMTGHMIERCLSGETIEPAMIHKEGC